MIHTALCDQCDNRIVGVRYKCCMCTDFDLCETCERKSAHDTSHIFLKASFSIRNAGSPRSFLLPQLYRELPDPAAKYGYHKGYICDVCKNVIYGSRFVCMDCSTPLNLCQTCEILDRHSEYHIVLKVVYPLPVNCLKPSFIGDFATTHPTAGPSISTATIQFVPPQQFKPHVPQFMPLPPTCHSTPIIGPTLPPNSSMPISPPSPPLVPSISPSPAQIERRPVSLMKILYGNINPNITIRNMKESDIVDLLALEQECFPLSKMPYKYFRNTLRHQSMKSVFVAEAKNEMFLVGYPNIPHFLVVKSKVLIESLAVSTQHRRKKIGDSLLCHGLAFLLKQQKTISLHVRKDNHAAIALYKKYGFVEHKEVPGYYMEEEHHCKHSGDAVIMRVHPMDFVD